MVFGLLQRKNAVSFREGPQSTQASQHITVTSVQRRPNAIAVILGYMGAETESMHGYAKLYHSRDISTVECTAPILAYAVNDVGAIGEYAIVAIREVARLVRMAELSEMGYGRVPVIVHVLGNGGAHMLEEMERRIREILDPNDLQEMQACDRVPFFTPTNKKTGSSRSLTTDSTLLTELESVGSTNSASPIAHRSSPRWGMKRARSMSALVANEEDALRRPRRRRKRRSPSVQRIDWERWRLSTAASRPRYNPEHRAFRRDIETFASHLAIGTIVFDSAPYMPTIDKELEAASLLLDGSAKVLAVSAITGFQSWHGIMHYSTLGQYPATADTRVKTQGRPEQFWTNMQQICLTKRIAYVYSQGDMICNFQEIKRLVRHQLSNGMSVTECPLVGTRHLEHRSRRIDLYEAFIDEIVDNIVEYRLNFENQDGWWSSDEENEKKHGIATRKLPISSIAE